MIRYSTGGGKKMVPERQSLSFVTSSRAFKSKHLASQAEGDRPFMIQAAKVSLMIQTAQTKKMRKIIGLHF